MRRTRLFESGDGALLVRDVDFAEDAAELRGDLFAGVCVDVEDRDFRAGRAKRHSARAAQTGRASRYDSGCLSIDFHGILAWLQWLRRYGSIPTVRMQPNLLRFLLRADMLA